MSFVTRFRKAFEQFIDTRSGNTLEVPGLLGNASLVVPTGNEADVYVTLWDGSVIEVVNRRVPNKAGTHVVVGIDPSEPGILQVLRRRGVFGGEDETVDVKNHWETHQYPNYDWLPVRQEQFLPLLVLPKEGFVVQVYAATVQKSDGSGWFRIANQTIDLSSYKPTAGAKYVLIESDDSGTLSVVDGSLVAAKEQLTLSDIPAGTGLPIVAVRLYDGQEEIRRDNVIDDFIDLRSVLLYLGNFMLVADYDSDADGIVDMAQGLEESSGPTELGMGSVSDGQFLKRVGSSIIGAGAPGDMLKAEYDSDGDGAVDSAEGLKESGGPTSLSMGSVPEGQYLKRSGSSIVGDTPSGSGDMTKAVYDTDDDGSVDSAEVADQAEGLIESGGPTSLSMGGISDGQYLKRSGSSIVGDTPGGTGDMSKSTYDTDDDGAVDLAEGLKETGGPTNLAMGIVADGELLKRAGSSIVGKSLDFDLGYLGALAKNFATVNTEDDQFDAASLDGKWSSYGSPTADLATIPGWVGINSGAIIQAVPAGDWTIYAEQIQKSFSGTSGGAAGIFLSSSDNPASMTGCWYLYYRDGVYSASLQWQKLVNDAYNSHYSGSPRGWTTLQARIWLALEKSGSTYTGLWSDTGVQWYRIFQTSSLGFTPAYFGLKGGGSYWNYFIRR